jgi:hypothetical protein
MATPQTTIKLRFFRSRSRLLELFNIGKILMSPNCRFVFDQVRARDEVGWSLVVVTAIESVLPSLIESGACDSLQNINPTRLDTNRSAIDRLRQYL